VLAVAVALELGQRAEPAGPEWSEESAEGLEVVAGHSAVVLGLGLAPGSVLVRWLQGRPVLVVAEDLAAAPVPSVAVLVGAVAEVVVADQVLTAAAVGPAAELAVAGPAAVDAAGPAAAAAGVAAAELAVEPAAAGLALEPGRVGPGLPGPGPAEPEEPRSGLAGDSSAVGS
jgi:hypothetical protein